MRVILISMMLLVLGWSQAQGKKDQKEVRKCFAGYKAAILEGAGEEAIQWVDKNTLEYYDRILRISISGDSAEVNELGVLDKLSVLSIRHRIPAEEILKMDGSALFIYAVNTGMVGKNSVSSIEIGEVTITGEVANGQLVSNKQASPHYFQFNKEDTGWRLDITSIFQPSEAGLERAIESNGQSENEFIFQALELLTGQAVKNQVWHPLRQ